MRKINIILLAMSILTLLATGVASAADYSGWATRGYGQSNLNYQPSFQTYYSQADLNTYWPVLGDRDACKARQDVVLQVAPAGCQPAVVRSDLLAEQNVPVFCQINALQLNPLLDIKEISRISFTGKYPKEVVGAGFHPAKAALRTRDSLLGDPLINNVGYVVLVLRKNGNESSIPESVNVTLSARLQYESGNAFGIGRYAFVLEEQSDSEWEQEKNKQSFLRGNYFIRLDRAEPEYALISVYYGDKRLSSVRVEKGKTSSDIYIPGFYCQAALQIAYDNYEAAQKKVRLEISDEKGTETLDVYENGRFLNNKCTVRKILMNKDGQTGNVTIKCDFNNEIILQKLPRTSSPVVGQEVLYNFKGKDETVKIEEVLPENKYKITLDGSKIDVNGYELKPIVTNEKKKPSLEEKQHTTDADHAFYEAIAAYEKIADDYPSEKEKDVSSLQTYGEKALYDGVKLARQFGKSETEYKLLERLINEYEKSESIGQYKKEMMFLSDIDSSLAGTLVYLDNKYRGIRVVDMSLPKKQSTAVFGLTEVGDKVAAGGYKEFSLEYNEEKRDLVISGVEYVKLSDLKTESADLLFKCTDTKKGESRVSLVRLDDVQTRDICGKKFSIVLKKTDGDKVARVRILPKVPNTQTQTNLSVMVGIEKRAIKLSPEKTKDRISILNESIKKWDSISNSLGKAVTGMKAACLATATYLTAKNFLTGLDGKAMARQKAMQDFGWNERCQDAISSGIPVNPEHSKYVSIDDCFRRNAGAIEKDVEAIRKAIEEDNKRINGLINQEGSSRDGGLLEGKVADYDKVASDFILGDEFKNKVGSVEGVINEEKKSVNLKDFVNKLSVSDYGDGSISYEQAKKLSVYASIANNPDASLESQKKAKEEIGRIVGDVNNNRVRVESEIKSEKAASAVFIDGSGALNTYASKNSNIGIWTGTKGNKLSDADAKKAIGEDTNVALVNHEGKDYLISLANEVSVSGCYQSIGVYDLNGDKLLTDDNLNEKIKKEFPCFKKVDMTYYKNKYSNPEIRYYVTEPYKGVPEVVPVDVNDGWYAGVKKDLSLFSGSDKGAIDASGAVASFWLCNVGPNKREEFRKDNFGDDICKRFDFYTGQAIDQFPGIVDKSKVTSLVQKSVAIIREAQKAYRAGIKPGDKIVVGGNSVRIGEHAISVSGARCQDFMSPNDCLAMFNVCDPVVCPTSRCNFGGQFYVQDVIQSGIIGSALLCLPNAKEGIYVPVCLSGLKAGVDGYVSVLKSHRDCLQENLETGKMIGICDEIYSIYMCDFFWRQAAPLANVLLPKLVASAYGRGQGTRGGGEYMTVMYAWENAKKSVDYFTQSYALNSFKAFQARSTEEIGMGFCKSFVSSKGPSVVKNLLEPDSPVQFYAQFDSTTYSTATFPATAQYKVFYHIFAGKDTGVYFNVYLKNPPETSYYYATPTIQVAAGFIPRGESVDQTRDFTAPEGYKELCVRINDKEECGFKQVSTSAAINYVKDKVVQSELQAKGITTEQDCISGAGLANSDFNTAALLNPNIQSMAQEAVSPKVYERGIVRVCATDNPASSTDPSRYISVGVCGNERIKCWLDTKSVNNAITQGNVGVRNATLEKLQKINIDNLRAGGNLLKIDDANTMLNDLTGRKKNLLNKIDGTTSDYAGVLNEANVLVKEVDEAFLKVVDENSGGTEFILNQHKAKLLYLKAEIKDAVAKVYLRQVANSVKSGAKNAGKPVAATSATPKPTTITEMVYTIKQDDTKEIYFKYSKTDNEWKWSFNEKTWMSLSEKVFNDPLEEELHGLSPDDKILSLFKDLGYAGDDNGTYLRSQVSESIVEKKAVGVLIPSQEKPSSATQSPSAMPIATTAASTLTEKDIVFEIDIKNKFYCKFDSGWQCSDDKKEWIGIDGNFAGLKKVDKNLIELLKRKSNNFAVGVNNLIYYLLNQGSGEIIVKFGYGESGEIIFNSEKIFEVSNLDAYHVYYSFFKTKYYYKYESGWKWSDDKEKWFAVSSTTTAQKKAMKDEYLTLLNSLDRKDYLSGQVIIFKSGIDINKHNFW